MNDLQIFSKKSKGSIVMPFDGIVAKCISEELLNVLADGRIDKVYQPEKDEITIGIRAKGTSRKLVISASPNNPRIHLTEIAKENPANAPLFCMILRKYLVGGKILSVAALDFERVITIKVESRNELNDTIVLDLIVEIMGRHSNIILVNDKKIIIDAIKHVDNKISRVREVAPARHYAAPLSQDKISPADIDCAEFFGDSGNLETRADVEKYMLSKIKGFSPLICKEISASAKSFSTEDLRQALSVMIKMILSEVYAPCIVFDTDKKEKLFDYHCLPIENIGSKTDFDSMSAAMDEFYYSRDKAERIAQKKSQLEKTLGNCLERSRKKLAIRQKTLKDVEDRDRFRLYGELIIANIHQMKAGQKFAELKNYYSETDEIVKIPMKENISLPANAQRYFKKYAKAKSTFEHTTKQIKENLDELKYLESVEHQLSIAKNHNEIGDILQELIDERYVNGRAKKSPKRKAAKKISEPMEFKSSDGFLIFVGKNNIQNDMLTMKMSSLKDMWLHIKDFPGSHVIIRSDGKEISDNAINQAAIIAAFYSKASQSSTVSIDYTQVKNVKKISGGKPGMVTYKNFKTIVVTPEEHIVTSLQLKTNNV